MSRKTAAAVLVVKNEGDEIAAWLAWYHVQGFDACIVFDDHSTDGTWESLQRAAKVQDIRLSRTAGDLAGRYNHRQYASYAAAIAQHRDEFEWLGFFDGDEYLALADGSDVRGFLARFPDADGIAVNWCNYGSSGHALKPKLLPVEVYTRHGDERQRINRHVKSLIRPDRAGGTWKNVHCFDVDPDRYVTASGERVRWGGEEGIIDRDPDWTVAKVMHFQCRSMEHFVERLRKRPELPAHIGTWHAYDMNQVEDLSPLRLVPAVRQQMARYAAAEQAPAPPPSQDAAAPSSVRGACIAKLWRGRDPYQGFPRHLYEADTQGWGSTHDFLTGSHAAIRPSIIVEVGVWKGASTIVMASKLRDLGLDAVVIAVDPWLGAWDHWTVGDWFDHLGWDHGYPTISRKFMNNVIAAGLESHVVPLPLDSLNAAQVLKHHQLRADIIHLDGAHDYESVHADLRVWWPLLRPGGLLIGDDYYPDTHWPGVKQAFDQFFSPRRPSPLENASGKCKVWKAADE